MLPENNIVTLDRGNNTTCTINLHGATVVSWRYIHQEQLFVSRLAVFDGKSYINGGISFVFPHYGPWTLGPHHGFARIVPWHIEKPPTRLYPTKDIEAIFSLTDTDYTRSLWNYKFRITYKIILREREIVFDFQICNMCPDLTFSFYFSSLSHIKIPDVMKCQIQGLKGCNYMDKNRNRNKEDREFITIQKSTDRIYLSTPNEHVLICGASDRNLRIEKCNLPDTITSSPWITSEKELVNIEEKEYQFMVCIKAGNLFDPVVLRPGAVYKASQKLEIIYPNNDTLDTLLFDYV